jgi:N-acetylglutamate synthase-like GNAT family acetyltransferase
MIKIMDVRRYLPTDRIACLSIFDSNRAAGRAGFEKFLEAPEGPYFVMEHDGGIVGCGGYTVDAESRLATLVWGMIRRDSHGQGLGRFLLMFRLREIGKLGGIERVRLETSQPAAKFFEGQGFKIVGPVNEGVEMVKKLTVCG